MSKYLGHIVDGFFIEAGAEDGIQSSNTKFLEEIGWKGILIEPSPSNFESCKVNRTAISLNCALVPFSYAGTHVRGNFGCNSGTDAIFPPPDYLSEEDKQSVLFKYENGMMDVVARTLDSIITEMNIEKIDFFSLDVEGSEVDVLGGLDFNRVRPYVFRIETANKQYYQDIVRDFMKGHDYQFMERISGNDDLFVDNRRRQ